MRHAPPAITLEARLEINACIEALMGDSETFPRSKAERLIELLPVTPRPSFFGMDVAFTSEGSVAEGATAGGGAASIAGGEETKSFSVGSDGAFKIGGYNIRHTLGKIDIGLMWGDDVDDRGTICRLTYKHDPRCPIELLLSHNKTIRLGILAIHFGRAFSHWKRPS